MLEDAQIERLKENVVFSYWEKKDDTHTVVRFATSWATKMEDVKNWLRSFSGNAAFLNDYPYSPVEKSHSNFLLLHRMM